MLKSADHYLLYESGKDDSLNQTHQYGFHDYLGQHLDYHDGGFMPIEIWLFETVR